jgi:hypothetical protein
MSVISLDLLSIDPKDWMLLQHLHILREY